MQTTSKPSRPIICFSVSTATGELSSTQVQRTFSAARSGNKFKAFVLPFGKDGKRSIYQHLREDTAGGNRLVTSPLTNSCFYDKMNTPNVANGLWVELQRSCPAATTSYVWWKYRPKTDGTPGPLLVYTSWRTIISTFVKGGSVLRMILEEDHSSSGCNRDTSSMGHRSDLIIRR